jgi:rare lipoprotein A
MKPLRLFSAFALLTALLAAGCSEVELATHYIKKMSWKGEQEQAGTYKIGQPYRVGTVWYYPHEDFNLVETGIASWYGPDFHGHRTANGEVYDQNELTGAHRTLQMPSLVRVTNLENGRSVVVRINDRGPYLHGRILDVSKRAAELLGFIGRGTARVKVETLPRESREIAEAAKRGMDTSRMSMADLERYQPGATPAAPAAAGAVPAHPVQVASSGGAAPDNGALPESLQTPTITVEQLNAPAGSPPANNASPPQQHNAPAPNAGAPEEGAAEEPHEFVRHLNLDEPTPAGGGMARGHMDQGHFMPDAVVSQEPVVPTGLFVQAGAFAVRENAERLKARLRGVAPVIIEPVSAHGRTLYRVKLGPIESTAKADKVLERVIQLGNDSARVIHNK